MAVQDHITTLCEICKKVPGIPFVWTNAALGVSPQTSYWCLSCVEALRLSGTVIPTSAFAWDESQLLLFLETHSPIALTALRQALNLRTQAERRRLNKMLWALRQQHRIWEIRPGVYTLL